jgi:ribosomal protein S27AE
MTLSKRCPACGARMILFDMSYWICLRCYTE